MPRYFQSTGDRAHDHELDELWRLYDALVARMNATASSDGASASAGSTGATGGVGDTGTGTVGSSDVGAGVGTAYLPGLVGAAMRAMVPPALTPSGTRQTVVGEWSGGGYVAPGDVVTIYSPGEMAGNLVIDGVAIIMPIMTGMALGATMGSVIGPALPMGPE